MRILGIDPGLRNMGWGVIDVDGSRLSHVANGVCHSEGTDLPLRLLSLFRQLQDVIRLYQPDQAAVEHTFVNKDGAGTLKLGQARGIAVLAPAEAGLAVGEYAPNQVKKTVVGVGHAAKQQAEAEQQACAACRQQRHDVRFPTRHLKPPRHDARHTPSENRST